MITKSYFLLFLRLPVIASLFSVLVAVCFFSVAANAQMQHEIFLAHTDHELHVYRVLGDEPGKTLMIIGGIQGDEPSSYMTADLYADIHLKKGNLIVVPRANFYSILLNKRNGQTGDMNRKFSPDPENKRRQHFEEEVVTVLKHLIAESDCLLNLHEGSGFYNPSWINSMENPNRYGQSIIFDAEVYRPPYGNREIFLDRIAENVIKRVNLLIDEKRYHFRANNHNTISEKSSHKEQRESATYYALTRAHIPAFGVETSKTIKSLETKTKLHKLVINEMMAEFGIVQDTPGVNVEEPKLDYLMVKVNNAHPYALRHGDTLELEPGDDVVISDIIANYQRGLVADVENFGTTNDTGRSFRASRSSRVYVRKDSVICGWVQLNVRENTPSVTGVTVTKEDVSPGAFRAESLAVDVNGETKHVLNMQTLIIPSHGRIILQGVRTNIARMDNEVMVNFKGFSPPKSVNDGNDLMYPIYVENDLLVRYSVNNMGKRYPIVASYENNAIGHFWVEIN
nr:hypothetical protein [Desulfobulbaceae bacterium]